MKECKINDFEEKLYTYVLDNGLEIYIVPTTTKKGFASMLTTKYGGRDINFKINDELYNTPTGIAHFLEHKMFEREVEPFKFFQRFGAEPHQLPLSYLKPFRPKRLRQNRAGHQSEKIFSTQRFTAQSE